MPLPVSDADKCSLDQLATADQEVTTDDLFKRKRMKGWWPSYEVDDEGNRLLNVRTWCPLLLIHFSSLPLPLYSGQDGAGVWDTVWGRFSIASSSQSTWWTQLKSSSGSSKVYSVIYLSHSLPSSPPLPPSSRPATSVLWFTSPWKTFKFIIWKYYKWHIIGTFVIIILIVLIVIFVYTAPVSHMKIMW